MQQNGNQEYSLNGLQFINPNMLPSYPLGYNFQSVLLNQQNAMINQPNMLLNQQNLILNSHANQLYQPNQLIPVSGQQMYLCNINSSNKNQLPIPAFVITPSPNLLPSTLISPTIADNQKLLKSAKRSSKKSDSTKKSASKKANKFQLEQQLQQLRQRQQIDEDSSDDDQDNNIDARFQQMLLMNKEKEQNGSEYGQLDDDMSVELEENNESENDNYEQQFSDSDEDSDMIHSRKRPKSHASNKNESDSDNEDRKVVLYDNNQSSMTPSFSGYSYAQDETTSSSSVEYGGIDLRFFKKERNDSDDGNKNSIDLDDPDEKSRLIREIQAFAKRFRDFRQTVSNDSVITQEIASKELSKFIKCSQSKICRFEKFYKDPQLLMNDNKLKSALETMKVLQNYMQFKTKNINVFDNLEVKARKKRINYKVEQLYILNNFFQNNPYPSEDEIDELSKQTNHSRQEIKVWFNNKRQTLKKVTK